MLNKKSTTTHGKVLQQLMDFIQSKQTNLGDKLPGEVALAKNFNVSRACIREALKVLAYSEIVETKPGVGTFIIKKSQATSATHSFEDLLTNSPYSYFLEVRRLLEGQSAYWAASRATDEELAELTRILENKQKLPLNTLHMHFHTRVAELSKNPIFIHLLALLEKQYSKHREINFLVLPAEDRLEHWRLLEAIKSKDPDQAKSIMENHVNFIWNKKNLLSK